MKHTDMLLADRDGVLFDVDGTLIDSMGIWKDIDRIYLEDHGIEMPAGLQKALAGLSIKQTADYFREVLGVNETQEQMLADWNDLAYQYYRYKIDVKEDAVRWLDEISGRGLKMAVCTSNTRHLAMTVLTHRDILKYFKVVLTGEDVVIGKPNPYIYLKAARDLGLHYDRCIVFEDIAEGILAGKKAGMRVCAVQDRFSDDQEQQKKELADYYINSFRDIFEDQVEILR